MRHEEHIKLRAARSMAMMLAAAVIVVGAAADDLARGFFDPPHEAKPQTWWHWMNGNVSKEGITADLEAMKEIGLGGAQIFDIGYGMPRGKVDFASPEWFDCVKHAAMESKRLGLDLALNTASGWSCAGGPWNVASNGMKFVTYSEKSINGPFRFVGKLPPLPFEGNYPSRYGNYFHDLAVVAYPTPTDASAAPSINHWQEILRVRNQRAAQFKDRFTKRKVAGGLVDPAREIDLTGKVGDDGTLKWDVPEGTWTILRIGYCANGRTNYPASDFGGGLECDKLSTRALDAHWSGFLDKLLKFLGPKLVGRESGGVTGIIVDSYEAGSQNWTDGFEVEFERRVGYSIKPWFPVFAGRTVKSREMTERFLEDFRCAVSDVFVENFGFATRRKAHAYGLELYVEPYGEDIPANEIEYSRCADIPMTEFWTGHVWPWRNNPAPPVSDAQVWGKKIVAAEAYTTWPKDDRWTLSPTKIKRLTDYQFCCGINRMVYHTYAHQPWTDPRLWPGMTMARFGIMFNRNVTWWNMGREWIRYQTRCQYMLQQGKPVADAFYFCGEGTPNLAQIKGRAVFGQNSEYLILSKEALMASKAVDGMVVSPGGVNARFLMLPEYLHAVSPEVMRKIEEFAGAGVTVVGEMPKRAFGLRGYPGSDKEVREISERLKARKNVYGLPAAQSVRRAGHVPDFARPPYKFISHTHRVADDGSDIYFLASQNDTNITAECRFRVTGRMPEIWNPMTGRIELAREWSVDGAMTCVTLDFEPDGSAFVVFRRKPTDGATVSVVTERRSILPIEGSWSLSFPAGIGAPAQITLDRLVSWTDRDEEGVRYFSGTATYCKTLAPIARRGDDRVVLDLGDVRELCEVSVNGKAFPVLWKRPYRVDITDALDNRPVNLHIRVTNVGANRLIGDEHKPEDCTWTDKSWGGPHLACWPSWMTNGQERVSGRRTFATWRHWSKEDKPLKSGLLGPVLLTFESTRRSLSCK